MEAKKQLDLLVPSFERVKHPLTRPLLAMKTFHIYVLDKTDNRTVQTKHITNQALLVASHFFSIPMQTAAVQSLVSNQSGFHSTEKWVCLSRASGDTIQRPESFQDPIHPISHFNSSVNGRQQNSITNPLAPDIIICTNASLYCPYTRTVRLNNYYRSTVCKKKWEWTVLINHYGH